MAIIDNLQVKGEALEVAISEFETRKAAMENSCLKMKNEADNLMNTYKGEASQQFNAKFNSMYANLQKNTEAMDTAIGDLKKVRDTYGSFEAAISKMIEAINEFTAYL